MLHKNGNPLQKVGEVVVTVLLRLASIYRRPAQVAMVGAIVLSGLVATTTAVVAEEVNIQTAFTEEDQELLVRAGAIPEKVGASVTGPAVPGIDVGGMTLVLPSDADGMAEISVDGAVIMNGEMAGSSDRVVIVPAGFGVITETHGQVEYRFTAELDPGMKVQTMPDGSLAIVNIFTGAIEGLIDPAYAIDEAGQSHPASYQYDRVTSELVLTADTTDAEGSVFIDPSWACKIKLAGLGLLFLVGVFAYFGSWWATYVWLKGLPYISSSLAVSIANSCSK